VEERERDVRYANRWIWETDIYIYMNYIPFRTRGRYSVTRERKMERKERMKLK